MPESRRTTLDRYLALERAFEAAPGARADSAARRYAAVALTMSEREPQALVAETLSADARLAARLSRWSGCSAAVRLGLAAILVEHGDAPEDFLDGLVDARAQMAELGLRRHPVYELIAYLGLRLAHDDRVVTLEDIMRVQELYEAMKQRHYFLTGPEDLPWCALLAACIEPADALAERAETIYQVLRAIADRWRWDPLQTASNMLALGDLDPIAAGERLVDIAERVRAEGYAVSSQEVDELALLCFPAASLDELTATLFDYARAIRERDDGLSLPLAANLTCVEFVGSEPELGRLVDAKLMLDLRATIERDEHPRP